MKNFMLLPSKTFENNLLVALPDDFESHAAFRCAVSIIAEAETHQEQVSRQEIINTLEDYGFQVVNFILGPEIA